MQNFLILGGLVVLVGVFLFFHNVKFKAAVLAEAAIAKAKLEALEAKLKALLDKLEGKPATP